MRRSAATQVVGQRFDRIGWLACVVGIGAAVGLATVLAVRLTVSVPAQGIEPSPCVGVRKNGLQGPRQIAD